MMLWVSPFSCAWRSSPLRFVPAVLVGLLLLVGVFGCQRWLPFLLGVPKAVRICSSLFAITGAATGIVTIITFFLVNKSAAEHSFLYAKYCATAVLMFLVFIAMQYGTVHIYFAAASRIIVPGAAFVVILIIAMVEALLVCVVSYHFTFFSLFLTLMFVFFSQILVHLCSFATLSPSRHARSMFALLTYSIKFFGILPTTGCCLICWLASCNKTVSLVLFLVSRIVGIIVAVKSFLETNPPLGKLESVNVNYPVKLKSEKTLLCNSSVVGHRIPVQRSLAVLPIKKMPGSIRIVQLSDVHLGSVTTPDMIHEFCMEIVETICPDFVFITGDMLTMPYLCESEEVVEYALEPLKTIKGHVFACLGNHDLETEASIKTAFEHCGIHLLSDDSVTLRITGCESPIQIVGFNYHPSHIHDNTMIYQRVFEQNPSPTPDTICLVLVCHFVF